MIRKLEGYADYPGVGKVTDEKIWQMIRKHSRLIDRMDSRKMVEMTQIGFMILCQILPINPSESGWMFYGKKQHPELKGMMSD